MSRRARGFFDTVVIPAIGRIDRGNWLVPKTLAGAFPESVLSRDESNQRIFDAIKYGDPFLVSRFGRSELLISLEEVMAAQWSQFRRLLLAVAQGRPISLSEDDRDLHLWLCGFYPRDDSSLRNFSDAQIAAGREIDLFGSWIPGENLVLPGGQKISITALPNIEPFLSTNPWTSALKGKSVLVVHPYEETIKRQYKRREHIHSNSDLLPKFQLQTLRTPITRFSPSDPEFSNGPSWFDRLESLKREVSMLDFDVAIVGAGAYGMPISAHVKSMGRVGINLGGASQLLFGIWGSRWDSYGPYSQLRNEYWVRPGPDETPRNAGDIDNRAYW